MSGNQITLTIFGDICPVADTVSAFCSERPDLLLSKEILNIINASDVTVGNLECAVTDRPVPIKKTGPILYASSKCVTTLATAGFSALSLANNHIRDCGSSCVDDTITICEQNGIFTFGAGQTAKVAKRPYIVSVKGKKIAFVSFAEEEFNAVSGNGSGAAILDVYYDFEHISRIRKEVDFLVVLYHGGIEYHPYPSPLLQKRCRRLAEVGADLVLCQHSHCIGSFEEYDGTTILYGQGNSLFGYRRNNASWNRSMLVRATIDGNVSKVEFLPCEVKEDSILHLCEKRKADEIIKEFENRSLQISSKDFIDCQWSRFCRKAESLNIPLLLGWNRYLIFVNRKLGGILLRLMYGKRKRNITHNLIRCESHYEVIRTILGKYNFE